MSRDTVLHVQHDDNGLRTYLNNLQDGNFNLLRADYFFPPPQLYDYYGRRVAYDGRIINDMAPRVSNDRLSMPLQRSEEQSYGMYQMPADRLQ